LSPAQDAKLDLFASVGDVFTGAWKYLFGVFDYLKGSKKTIYESVPIKFDWSDADTSLNATYILEITSATNPSTSILTKEVKGISEYTLSGNDSLSTGKYVWKVKMRLDGNDGPWSESREFEITSMSGRVVFFSIAIIVLALAALVFIILTIRANFGRF
jgi:hypothetical protein